MKRRTLIALTLLGALGSCSKEAPSTAPRNDGTLRVLFLGNSLTYTNDLPSMVRNLGRAAGLTLDVDSYSQPNYALEDHWNDEGARERVRTGHYDVVILQQGPSSLASSRTFLREWAATWNGEIRARGGRPALYAVWPERDRLTAFADVSESYRLAAQDVQGLFFPVGDTWTETWARVPDAPLYGADGFHPGVAGTYAAAVVIVSVLGGVDPDGLAMGFEMPPGTVESVDPFVAAEIRSAAHRVLARIQPALAR